MARLPRLALPDEAHWVIQRGTSGRPVFADDDDRRAYLAALREAAAVEQVRIHAWALPDTEVHLLARPASAPALSRLMQAVGRRYVSAYHRRHGGSGTLWDGRFRATVVEPGAALAEVLVLIDGLATLPGQSSLGSRTGASAGDGLLTDPPEFWSIGNTPFDRQALWRQRVSDGLPAAHAASLVAAARGGWVVGSAAFAARVAEATGRPASPRPRGRPARAPRRA
jgi:putative transposase